MGIDEHVDEVLALGAKPEFAAGPLDLDGAEGDDGVGAREEAGPHGFAFAGTIAGVHEPGVNDEDRGAEEAQPFENEHRENGCLVDGIDAIDAALFKEGVEGLIDAPEDGSGKAAAKESGGGTCKRVVAHFGGFHVAPEAMGGNFARFAIGDLFVVVVGEEVEDLHGCGQ